MYISNYFAGSPIYDETLSKFRNKAKENSRQAFSDFISENEDRNKEQAVQVASCESENVIADNGVKSTLILGRLDSQRTKQNQNSGSMSTINLTDEELEGWHNGTHDYTSYYLPEVVRRYKEYDPELSEAAESLLDYLKDYPGGSDKA